MKIRLPYYFLSALMLGAVSQIGQVLFLRELLMVFHGNEISIGIILSAWLAWVGLGSGFGAVILKRINRPLFLLALNATGVLITLPASILLIRDMRGFFNILPGASLSLLDMAVSSFIVMAPSCLLLGGQFVLLSRIWRENDQAEDTSGAGKAYIGEATGNMIGGIAFVLLLVHYPSALQSAVIAGMLMLIFALLTGYTQKIGTEPLLLKLRPALWVIPIMLALVFPFIRGLDDWSYQKQWRNFAPQYELIETAQSKHGTVSVVRREDQYSFFQSGHLLFTIAGRETKQPGFEEQDAAEFVHLSMVQHKKPERILLIGGGLRGILSEMLKHPVQHIDYVELDKTLTKTVVKYVRPKTIAALADNRVRKIHTDGRLFVKTTDERYDIIIVDVPDPATAALNRFYTKEFFREAQKLLKRNGVFVVNTISTPNLRGTAIANRNATVYHTLARVFPRVLIVGERLMIYFASHDESEITTDAHVLQQRYLARDIESESFSSHHYHTLLPQSQIQRVNWIVRNHGRSSDAHIEGPGGVPLFPGTISIQERGQEQLPPVHSQYFINSDFKPIGYFYTLMFKDDQLRSERSETFKILLRMRHGRILFIIFIPIIIALGLRLATRRDRTRNNGCCFSVLFAVFTTGLSTMALQIAVLFSFQSIYGFIYESVGLIVAIFMAGLAAGAFLTHKHIADKTNLHLLALIQLGICVFSFLLAVALPATAATRSPVLIFILFSTLTFTSGFINGVDFPIAMSCYTAMNKYADKSAGTVYGIELLGACISATLASAVIAPILGIIACCVFSGIANGTAFMVLLISKKSGGGI